jgi:hypothetical protein
MSSFRSLRRGVSLLLATLAVAVLAGACGPTISTFSAEAYDRATALKVESLALMDSATTPYAEHAASVRRLRTELRKAHEFARGRPHNEVSARQWAILIAPERDLLGGFLHDWKQQSSFSPSFVREKKEQVAAAFDTIIELESGKRDPDEVRVGR